jgi:hypothetical protein
MARAMPMYDYSRRHIQEWPIQRPRFVSPCWKAERPQERLANLLTNQPSEGDAFEARFRKLVQQWYSESENLSSVKAMVELHSYRQIVKMGQPIIRLLLLELKERPNIWFAALREITGEKHIGKGVSFPEAVGAWLKWGNDNQYLHEGTS